MDFSCRTLIPIETTLWAASKFSSKFINSVHPFPFNSYLDKKNLINTKIRKEKKKTNFRQNPDPKGPQRTKNLKYFFLKTQIQATRNAKEISITTITKRQRNTLDKTSYPNKIALHPFNSITYQPPTTHTHRSPSIPTCNRLNPQNSNKPKNQNQTKNTSTQQKGTQKKSMKKRIENSPPSKATKGSGLGRARELHNRESKQRSRSKARPKVGICCKQVQEEDPRSLRCRWRLQASSPVVDWNPEPISENESRAGNCSRSLLLLVPKLQQRDRPMEVCCQSSEQAFLFF